MATRTTHVIGSLTFQPRAKLRLTDPCYCKDHPNSPEGIAILDNIQPGNWTVMFTGERVSSRETRVAKLSIMSLKHNPFDKSSDEHCIDELFVDSGQFGIFDDSLYPGGLSTGDYEDPATFYGRACAPREWAAIMPEGVVCDAGWGDGSYHGRYITTNGLVTFVEVTFMDENESEGE